ncbi:50S ribosomal protein L25 [Leucobacter sp. UCD-THU]|jgi:large subunit ribosomal protein L25|uniref:Large ribosomal subunit protein bL25 n=1 Tax=Leucobacter muris TaxID=1935379 RepID=A0ABX5QE15_9MICO|nr:MULTISPECIES: 50S ribosomal protein L25/general stress protein Ctc [Leucobacter]EYT51993.1 50S ribosomal protein L25 [Leucobacter sp. UCD-THU]QAB17318.1 50S ribosomal protein L25/general stress protein Ctc [Leucobacter muris]
MSETNQLVANTRDNFGKGAARKLRAAGQTPAVVYGHGTDPVHVSVETHPLSLIVRHANAIIELDIDGRQELVLVKDVQRDPVRQIIEHIDLLVVKKGETVEVEVPVHVTGESFSGTNALQELNTLRLSVPATSIPENVEVNVEGLEEGAQILAGAVALPAGATLLDPEDQLVVHVVVPRGAAGDEDEAAEEAAE